MSIGEHPPSPPVVLRTGLESAGVPMTPEEFDAIEDYDELFQYELIRGVLVVREFPDDASRHMSQLLGHWVRTYAEAASNPLVDTVYGHYLQIDNTYRRADRVIWAALGHVPIPHVDVPAIVIEFPSAGRVAWKRDYIEKRQEYLSLGVREYWVINRIERVMTVYTADAGKTVERRVGEFEVYQTPLLPGFEFPLARLLAAADQWK